MLWTTVMAWQLRNPDATDVEQAMKSSRINKHRVSSPKPSSAFLDAYNTTVVRKGADTQCNGGGTQGHGDGSPQKRYDTIEDENLTRPWKLRKKSLLWTYSNGSLAVSMRGQRNRNWPLLIPPLLTLIDDVEVKYKVLGCELVTTLLTATSPALLARTGLGDVMQDAIRPCLSYLPTLTPEEDSIHILNAAYPAMLALFQVQFHPPKTAFSASAKPSTEPRPPTESHVKALSNLLDTDLLPSLSHCTSHPAPSPPFSAT